MTPNEKAATFIGWKPDVECEGFNFYTYPKPCYYCDVVLDGRKRGDYTRIKHMKGAPAMSEPRNFLKALDSFGYCLNRYEDGQYECIIGPVYTYGGTITGAAADGRGETMAAAALVALAALYDAGHPND